MAQVDVLSGRGERQSIIQLASMLALDMLDSIIDSGGGIGWTHQSYQRQAVG